MLCDTPGINESRSAVIDVSNCLGILRAIHKAEVVKPVLLIYFSSLVLDKGKPLKELLKYYGNMISNVERNIKKFNYMFTHCLES